MRWRMRMTMMKRYSEPVLLIHNNGKTLEIFLNIKNGIFQWLLHSLPQSASSSSFINQTTRLERERESLKSILHGCLVTRETF